MHAKLLFHPEIGISAESVAQKLHLDLDQADQLLSRPGTHEALQVAMQEAFQITIFTTLVRMQAVPHERVPVRVDASMPLTGLSIKGN